MLVLEQVQVLVLVVLPSVDQHFHSRLALLLPLLLFPPLFLPQ